MKAFSLLMISCLILCNCSRQDPKPDRRMQITGDWIFSEKPARLTNPWMGHIEDRTVFSGDEILGFHPRDSFFISDSLYGSWTLDSLGNIAIDLSQSGGYATAGFNQNYLYFEIREISDSSMRVEHNFYRFYGNTYQLKKIL